MASRRILGLRRSLSWTLFCRLSSFSISEAGVIGPGWGLDIDALPYEAAQRRSERVRSLMEPAQFESRKKSSLEASAACRC